MNYFRDYSIFAMNNALSITILLLIYDDKLWYLGLSNVVTCQISMQAITENTLNSPNELMWLVLLESYTYRGSMNRR